MATVTRALGAASDPVGNPVTVEIDYEDVVPFRLLKIRTNATVPVAVTATDVATGRVFGQTFQSGTRVASLPTAVATRLVMTGVRRGVPVGVKFEIRVPA